MNARKSRFTIHDKIVLQKAISVYRTRLYQYKREGRLINNLNVRLKSRQLSLKSVIEKQKEVIIFAKIVQEFTGINLYGKHGRTDKKGKIAKGILCVYLISEGLGGEQIGWYLGYKNSDTSIPHVTRRRFLQRISRNPEIKTIWQRFKDFINQRNESNRETQG